MKTLQAVISISILLLLSAAATAQSVSNETAAESTEVTQTLTTDVLFDRFEKTLVQNLGSDVPGIVESALFNAVEYKIAYPRFQSRKVEDQLYKLAVNGQNHTFRYKAYLTFAYYTRQSQFDEPAELANLLNSDQKDGIFFYLQEKIQSDQFTSNF